MTNVFAIAAIVLWIVFSSLERPAVDASPMSILIFFAGVVPIVLIYRLWAARVVREFDPDDRFRRVWRLHKFVWPGRLFIVAWFGLCLFEFGLGDFISSTVSPFSKRGIDLPGLLMASVPVFAALAAMWWALFPLERERHEQRMIDLFTSNLPVASPPRAGRHVWQALRVNVLFVVVPVMLAVAAGDVGRLIVGQNRSGLPVQAVLFLLTLVSVFVISPWALTFVLETRSLPDSPLRDRLMRLAGTVGVRVRDIRIWNTNLELANAALIGLIPRTRYVLITDLLLETMTDEQIESVFAHESGHIRHRHVEWYAILVVCLLLVLIGPGQWMADELSRQVGVSTNVADGLSLAVILPVFLLVFGVISRCFEREADLFAVQAMSAERAEKPDVRGATTFISALGRVASLNGMPVDYPPAVRDARSLIARLCYRLRNFRHPGVGERMELMRRIALGDLPPAAVERPARLVKVGLLLAVISLAAVVVTSMS